MHALFPSPSQSGEDVGEGALSLKCDVSPPPLMLSPYEQPNIGARSAKEKGTGCVCPSAPETECRGVPWTFVVCTKRLSATDISALASMKNVAKCDTWCELQNPVNHRVFERKLRPMPSG